MSRNSDRRPVQVLLLLLLVVAGAFLLVWRQRMPAVQASLDPQPQALGLQTPLVLQLRGERGGLLWAEIRVRQGDKVVTAHRHEFPPASPNEATLEIPLHGAELGLSEGPVTLEVVARDGFWRPLGPSEEPILRLSLPLDLTPPLLRWVAGTRYPQQGGSALALLATAEQARVGVAVGEWEFPGFAATADGPMAVLYGIPYDHPEGQPPRGFAEDLAGNRRELALPVSLRPKRFERGSVTLQEEFLAQKLPELLPEKTDLGEDDYAEAFLLLSRGKRQEADERKRELARQAADHPLWQGVFVQPRNTRVFSDFATTREYRYEGRVLDTQPHMGFDLASTRNALIPAANRGRVVFAGPLTLYGNTVILDHGWGLQTLYAHLSAIEVAVDDQVEKEQVLGRSGMTGLAVGDHLHYEVLVGGLPVNPLQWWDRGWIDDHIRLPLEEAGLLALLPSP